MALKEEEREITEIEVIGMLSDIIEIEVTFSNGDCVFETYCRPDRFRITKNDNHFELFIGNNFIKNI